MSDSDLGAVLRGPKVMRSVFGVLGRPEAAERIIYEIVPVTGPDGAVIGEVSQGTLRQIAALNGTAYALSFSNVNDLRAALEAGQRIDPQSGEIVPFGWNDIGRYRLETERNTRDAATDDLEESVASEDVPSAAAFDRIDQEIEARIQAYTRDYDVTAWVSTDYHTLRQLAYAELRLEAVQRAQLRAVSGSKDAEAANKIRTEEAERLIGIIGKLKDALQISLKARSERAKQTQADQIVTQLAEQGKRLMAERMMIWQHCGVEQFMAFPIFPDCVTHGTLTIRCARCGKEFKVNVVTQRMLETYATAGDFIPADAPPGMFDSK